MNKLFYYDVINSNFDNIICNIKKRFNSIKNY